MEYHKIERINASLDFHHVKNLSVNRRTFLKMATLLGLGIVSANTIPNIAGAVRFNQDLYKLSDTRLAMGTFVSMTIYHSSKHAAEEAMALAYDEIDRLTNLMNRFDEKTAIGQLNNEGVLKNISPDIIPVIHAAFRYYHLTDGAFDISVKPLMDLYEKRLLGNKKTYPTQKEIKETLNLIGLDKVELTGTTLRFKRPGMGITLDGIAKGYIVDRASELLCSLNIDNHLINAGGDVRATGTKQDKQPWKVAIQDPRKQKDYRDIIHLTNSSIATSGNYENFFDKEKMFHHIIDPRTGFSPQLCSSVSVIAHSAMDADALSTSVFVMTPDKGTCFINSLTDCESLIITRGDKEIRSSGWKSEL